jgi:hypothetical protein
MHLILTGGPEQAEAVHFPCTALLLGWEEPAWMLLVCLLFSLFWGMPLGRCEQAYSRLMLTDSLAPSGTYCASWSPTGKALVCEGGDYS